MAFSPGALLKLLRREQVKDPFGGDDGFDGESRFAGKGPKIALAASGVLFLALIGFVVTVVMTGDQTASAPAVGGMLADLQVEEDDAPAAAPAAPGTPAAPGAAAPKAPAAPAVADATAATDRSASRRPWLAPSAPAPDAGKRLGVDDAAKPPAAKTAAAPPPPAPAAATPAPAAPKAPAETKTAAVTPPTASPAKEAPPAAKAPATPAPAAVPAPEEEEEKPMPTEVAGIPSLTAPGAAPGAPKRFDLAAGSDTGPTAAGGRPRMAEPPIPPTDKIAVSAPPPRFANLADVKKDAKTAAPPPANAAKLAVVVNGLGLSQAATEAAITKLPPAVTLAFSPYARDLKKWLEKAKASGHEVLIEVPMESKSFPADDPGPLGLLTGNDAKENGERLATILKESASAIGVLDNQGSKFREDQGINAVFAKLKEHNLFYVQGEPGVRVGEATVPTAISDVVVDERPFRAAVDARLDYAERLAKYQGSAVASLSAKPVSFERLVLWLEQSQKKGVVLTPISQVLIR